MTQLDKFEWYFWNNRIISLIFYALILQAKIIPVQSMEKKCQYSGLLRDLTAYTTQIKQPIQRHKL